MCRGDSDDLGAQQFELLLEERGAPAQVGVGGVRTRAALRIFLPVCAAS